MEAEEATASVPTKKKKKRNLPGMPDPSAEVIALSPQTLLATNRFVCEICNKGFQRDQNLQLHRRGHNLPWKLLQRSTTQLRKRVYVCPEPSCVHHDPARALGDLTGIKKHFSRKHGEKKWKCDKCTKKYAVVSDWKAHLKTCGTREYRCDCGTSFSRRDSFITHRPFCDALAEDTAKVQIVPQEEPPTNTGLQSFLASPSPQTRVQIQNQNQELPPEDTTDTAGVAHQVPPSTCVKGSSGRSGTSSNSSSLFANIFAATPTMEGSLQPQTSSFWDLLSAMARTERPTGLAQGLAIEPPSLSLSSNSGSTLFALKDSRQFAQLPQPTMSATALLQKAAQVGATSSNGSFLRGLGVSLSSSSSHQDSLQWNTKMESDPLPCFSGIGIGIGLPCNGNSRLTDLMMAPSTLFGPQPTTLDFLGLGMGDNGTSKGGFSALITSMDSDLDLAPASIRDEGL